MTTATRTKRLPKPRLDPAPSLAEIGLVSRDGVISLPDCPKWWEPEPSTVQLELWGFPGSPIVSGEGVTL